MTDIVKYYTFTPYPRALGPGYDHDSGSEGEMCMAERTEMSRSICKSAFLSGEKSSVFL